MRTREGKQVYVANLYAKRYLVMLEVLSNDLKEGRDLISDHL